MWLTTAQLIEIGINERQVRRKIASGEWESQVTRQRGRNGKSIRQVKLDSLPEKLQTAWATKYLAQAEPEPQSTPGPATLSSSGALAQALAPLTPDLREAMMREIARLDSLIDRFDSLSPKSYLEKGKRLFVPAVDALCQAAVCSDSLILQAEPSRAEQPSGFTLERWSRQRREVGLLAFLRSKPVPHKSRDKRVAGFSPDALDWLNSNWRNYPTQSHCLKKLRKLAARKKWQLPSNSTLRRLLSDIPPVVKARAFGTEKDYTSKWKPHVPRTVADLAALQVVCGDHHQLDVVCWSETLQSLVRLWLTVWQCVRTGLIWGHHLDYTPSSHTIACAYANGVRAYGAQPFSRPHDGFTSYGYTDNGKDYKGRGVNGEIVVHGRAAQIDGGLQLILTAHRVGLLNEAGVEHLLANLYNGREKPVERTFNDAATSLQNDFFKTGWCGRSPKDRPDAYRELYARHLKAMRHKRSSPFPSEQEVRDYMADWIVDYNTSEHLRSTLGGARVVPLTEFHRLYTTRYEIGDEALALMLLKPAGGSIGKNGVRMLGATYAHEALSEYKGVKGVDGKPIRIEARYSDEDYSTVWLVLPDGRVVQATRLDRSPILNPNRETHRIVATLTRHEAQLTRDFSLLAQSRLRGETTEERAVALIGQEEEAELAVAVGEEHGRQASVRRLTRFDGKRLQAVPAPRVVTTQEVAAVESDISIFEVPNRGKVNEFDFEECVPTDMEGRDETSNG